MKIKLKIQQKIQIFIITASILIYLIALGYISINARKMAYNDAIIVTDKYVGEVAKDIKAQLDADMSVVKTLSNAYLVYESMPNPEWKHLFEQMYIKVFSKNPHFYALWDSWELKVIDPNWTKSIGRYSMVVAREMDGSLIVDSSYRSMETESRIYDKIIKHRRIPSIWEPYLDEYTVGENEQQLMTTLNSPIMNNGQYVGIVAIDITLDNFQKLVADIKPYEGSYSYLVSYEGTIAGHPNLKFLNNKLEDVFPEDYVNNDILEKIKAGEAFNYISKDENGVETYYSYSPIHVVDTNTPWSIAISVPVKTIMAKAILNFRISLIVGILGILLMVIIIAIIGRNITNPITKITVLLKKIAKGYIDETMRINIKTRDEIEEMANALNQSVNGLNNKVEFANSIGQGKLNEEFELLSEEDILGKSLLEMRASLVKAEEEDQKRKIEDEKRRWINEGLAQFGDILRQNNDNLEKLATEIIMNLVGYLKANQGGIFILNDDDKENIYFDLLSSYAYDRRKFMQKQIELGEGLVGNCAIEKKTIYMTDIPQDYMEITSGLGGSNPNSLLIVPLKLEEEVLGVLEIASFNIFEKYEIEFIEKLAESIGSTLSSVRINIRTNELLNRSQQQAEEMAAQEEEMRQNMEELKATQEESLRKSTEMEGLVEALNTSSFVIEYDLDGYIQSVNDYYLNLVGLSREEIVGTHHSLNMEFTAQQKDAYDNFWRELRAGKIQKETTKVKVNNKELVFAETYTPLRNEEGNVYKILKISTNITDYHT